MDFALEVEPKFLNLKTKQNSHVVWFRMEQTNSDEEQYFYVKCDKFGIRIHREMLILWREGISSSTKKIFEKRTLKIVDTVVHSVCFFWDQNYVLYFCCRQELPSSVSHLVCSYFIFTEYNKDIYTMTTDSKTLPGITAFGYHKWDILDSRHCNFQKTRLTSRQLLKKMRCFSPFHIFTKWKFY